MNRKENIIATVKDLVSAFLYYDRKEDEELGVGDIEKALNEGEIKIEDICECFVRELMDGIRQDVKASVIVQDPDTLTEED